MSSIIYNKYFGKEYSYSLFKTQEKISKNKYIYYYQNSLSSFIYLFSGFYICINRKNYNFSSIIIEILLILLSFVSFFWWASQRLLIHKVDVLLYSSFLLIPGLHYYTLKNVINNIIFISILIIFNFMNYILIKKKYYLFIKLINFLSIIFSIYSLYEIKNLILYDVSLFFISFFCKFGDTFKFINYKNISGTALFHIISGLAYGTLILKMNNNYFFPK